MRGPPPRLFVLSWEVLVVMVASTVVYAMLVAAIDNVHLVTTNGLWKSLKVSTFVQDPGGSASPSNLIYYPVTGVITHFMPESVFGPVWRRMAYLNTAWSGVALGALWAVVRTLGGGRLGAAAAVLFQAGCGFFLALAITNEDVMGGYALMMSSIACAVYGFHRSGRDGTLATVLAALLFDLCWFWEWRLLFPVGPAFAIALLAGAAPPRLRLQRAALFFVFAAGLLIAAATVANHFEERSVLRWVGGLLWTGKGVGTGWGGFAARKWTFLWIGMTQYWVGGVNVNHLEWMSQGSNLPVSLGVLLGEATLAAFLFHRGLQNWRDGAWRTFGFLAGGTFLAGQLMNLYSQPQDPQMQLNPMFWLAIAWGLAVTALARRARRAAPLLAAMAVAVTSLWLPINLWRPNGFWSQRGGDPRMLDEVRDFSTAGDLENTLFVFNGFEGILSWIAVEVDWTYPPTLTHAPQPSPRFKGLFLLEQATEYPQLGADESAALVSERLADAERRGFRIVTNEIWSWSEPAFVDSFSTVSGAEKPTAIYRALHDRYEGRPVFEVKGLGPFYELSRRQEDPS